MKMLSNLVTTMFGNKASVAPSSAGAEQTPEGFIEITEQEGTALAKTLVCIGGGGGNGGSTTLFALAFDMPTMLKIVIDTRTPKMQVRYFKKAA